MTNARNRRVAARRRSSLTTTAILLGIGLTGPLATSTPNATAAPLRTGYTLGAPTSRAVVLDQEGRRIALPRAGGEFPAGTTPTYVAYRLPGRSQVPDGVPLVASAAGRNSAGPLRLDALALRSLNTELAGHDRVAVVGARQAFLVESASPSSLAHGGDGSVQYWRPGVQGDPSGKSIGDTVGGWFDSSADAVKKINNQIADALKKAFTPPSPKPVIIPPARVAAQVLEGEMQTQSSPESATAALALADDAQAAPVPEPAAWLVFAAASAFGLRLRSRKPPRAASPV
ncbi:hypothetical protein [Planctomyces sp. SH-PL62]|uniref:hypothetical protein n=1 Tax=Planctomyces sp. SH-PL62 TaxID=1636152 RepID=UPI0012E8DD3A|nr:hypothetical protein [Planctomyces sp. SH-PL62]